MLKDKLTAFIPNHLLVKQGIVKEISLDVSEDELIDPMVSEFSRIYGPIKILHAKRFNKKLFNPVTNKVELIPTTTVQVTVKGQFLPAEVKINKVVRRVETYYPQIRQCYRCFQFGHVKANCKSSNELCLSCGQVSHSNENGDECPRKELPPICLHCKQEHIATEKTCPARLQEQDIRNMATDQNSSVAEIKKEIREKRNINPLDFPVLTQNSAPSYNVPSQEFNNTIKYGFRKNYRDATMRKASHPTQEKIQKNNAQKS